MITTLIALIVGLVHPAPQAPKPPQGWLDCGFDQRNVYRCKP